MKNGVNIERKSEYLLVTVTDFLYQEVAMKCFQEILSACIEFNTQKVLLDFHLIDNKLSMVDEVIYIKRIALEYQQYIDANNPPLKIAFWGGSGLVKPHSPSPKIGKETGLDMIVTDSETAAIDWLNH